MYCPQCGKEQIGNEVRFCSRCGFQMGVVSELMSSNGVLTRPFANSPMPPAAPSPRKKGMKTGALLMFISAVLTPIFIALSVIADHPAPLLAPLTIFLAGVSWLIFSAIFGEETATRPLQHFPQAFNPPPYNKALPNAEPFRVTNLAPHRINTSEIVEPPSVTDHTTQLFDKE